MGSRLAVASMAKISRPRSPVALATGASATLRRKAATSSRDAVLVGTLLLPLAIADLTGWRDVK